MNISIEQLLKDMLMEVRSDIKSIRDVLYPMREDLQYHILRTDFNEARITELEEKLLEEAQRANELAERKLRVLKLSIGIVTSIVTALVALRGAGFL